MSKELITIENKEIQTLDFNSPVVIKTLKDTVAQGLTDSEFLLFAEHCKSTGLNPFKKEVWAIKAGGRLQLMTGINGYFTTANRHPAYNGYEEGFIGKNGEELSDTYPGNDYVGAWCKVYRKDRAIPAKGVAFRTEYDKGHGNWKTMPKVMILKCAESVGLRKAFPQELNGSYTAEEMPVEFAPSAKIIEEPRPLVVPADNLPVKANVSLWDGEEIVTSGKYKPADGKKTKWKDVPYEYLVYVIDAPKATPETKAKAEKEVIRRDTIGQPDFEAINEAAITEEDLLTYGDR